MPLPSFVMVGGRVCMHGRKGKNTPTTGHNPGRGMQGQGYACSQPCMSEGQACDVMGGRSMGGRKGPIGRQEGSGWPMTGRLGGRSLTPSHMISKNINYTLTKSIQYSICQTRQGGRNYTNTTQLHEI